MLTVTSFKEGVPLYEVSPILKSSEIANPPLGWGDVRGIIRTGDPFGYQMAGANFLLPSRLVPSGAFVGVSQANWDYDFHKISYRPRKLDETAYYNDVHYGNLYHRGWLQFVHTMSGGSVRIPSMSGENPVRHSGYTGSLQPKVLDRVWAKAGFNFFGVWLDDMDYLTPLKDRLTVTSVSPLDFATGYNTPVKAGFSMHGLWSRIRNYGFTSPYYRTAYWNWCSTTITNVSISDVREPIFIVDYHVSVHSSLWNDTYNWDTRVKLTPSFNDIGEVYSGDFVYPTQYILAEAEFTGFSKTAWNGIVTTGPDIAHTTGHTCYMAIEGSTGGITPPAGSTLASEIVTKLSGNVPNRLHWNTMLGSFEHRIQANWKHITPASAFSALSAYQNCVGGLSNNLQTLTKLPAFMKAVPDMELALGILSDLMHMNLGLRTLADIMDLMTQIDLQRNFTWRPYVDLIQNQGSAMQKILSEMLVTQRFSVGYGQFVHQFDNPNHLGRVCTLTVRSKVVVDLAPNGVLAGALGLDRAGLLPTPSRVWDLYPFTFLVNWATGVGTYLKMLEKTTYLWLVPMYLVHTYSFQSSFTDSELDYLQASNQQGYSSGLKLFYRDVTSYSPTVRYSKFNFGIPTELQNPVVLGSLFYQLLKG